MTVLVAIAAMLTAPAPTQTPTEAPVARPAGTPTRCSPCAYSNRAQQRARRELKRARWYLRRHNTTRHYRDWLASTRTCESRNDYHALGGGGLYRGAYQFDYQTWYSVGGRGDPAGAPPIEQDYRAVVLLQRRGPASWPVCG